MLGIIFLTSSSSLALNPAILSSSSLPPRSTNSPISPPSRITVSPFLGAAGLPSNSLLNCKYLFKVGDSPKFGAYTFKACSTKKCLYVVNSSKVILPFLNTGL